MIIRYSEKAVPFGDISFGGVFVYENKICMRIGNIKGAFSGLPRFIDLETGAVGCLEDFDVKVLPKPNAYITL